MTQRLLVRFTLVGFLCLASSTLGLAQYGTGSTSTSGATGGTASTGSAGSYGSGAGIGIGIGAAAAGAVLIYWATHHKTTLVGCVLSGGDGMMLKNERDQRTYALGPGSESLKPGERVELQGKKTKDDLGRQIFRVQKVAKNLGACNGESASNLAPLAVRP
jgi:hypothetical protein